MELLPEARTLLSRKIDADPVAFRSAASGVRAQLGSGWRAATLLAERLSLLPAPALRWWAHQERSRILLAGNGPTYGLDNICRIPLHWIVSNPREATIWALLPLDHLLGCGGAPQGQWLSEGGGISPRWQDVGARMYRLFSLGYGGSERAVSCSRFYLAEGLVQYADDRRALHASDPKLARLLNDTLLSPSFWMAAGDRDVSRG